MRYTSAKTYKAWWRTINAKPDTWTNKDADCALENLGKHSWEEIYAEHLCASDTVRDLPKQLDRQLGLDALILTPRGTRSVQEKVRNLSTYDDIGIEIKKRDPADKLGCADYRIANYYAYAEYAPETRRFRRWIILHWPLLGDTISPREIEGTNNGGGGMHLYRLDQIRSQAPAAIIAQSGYY